MVSQSKINLEGLSPYFKGAIFKVQPRSNMKTGEVFYCIVFHHAIFSKQEWQFIGNNDVRLIYSNEEYELVQSDVEKLNEWSRKPGEH
ncbi:MAG: hypothetical protein KC414_13515 [Romboutsia sp.]|nr:hypothetical protein [Romboutsia sp.]